MSVIVKHASTMYVLVSRSGDLDNYTLCMSVINSK